MTDLEIQQAAIQKLEAENKKQAAVIKKLNSKLAQHYKTITDLMEENNELLTDLKTQQEASDKEIDRLLGLINNNGLSAE